MKKNNASNVVIGGHPAGLMLMDRGECENDLPGFGVRSVIQKLSA